MFSNLRFAIQNSMLLFYWFLFKLVLKTEKMEIHLQLLWLFLLAIPIACVAWTVTHEEVFREPREFCIRKSRFASRFWQRKFYYLFTCEYCFSHYVTVGFIFLTDFRLLLDNWKGYIIAGFALVFVANIYMSLLDF